MVMATRTQKDADATLDSLITRYNCLYTRHGADGNVVNLGEMQSLSPNLTQLLENVPGYVVENFLRFVLCVMRKCFDKQQKALDFCDETTRQTVHVCAIYYFG
jgi:hypothetical protein